MQNFLITPQTNSLALWLFSSLTQFFLRGVDSVCERLPKAAKRCGLMPKAPVGQNPRFEAEYLLISPVHCTHATDTSVAFLENLAMQNFLRNNTQTNPLTLRMLSTLAKFFLSGVDSIYVNLRKAAKSCGLMPKAPTRQAPQGLSYCSPCSQHTQIQCRHSLFSSKFNLSTRTLRAPEGL